MQFFAVSKYNRIIAYTKSSRMACGIARKLAASDPMSFYRVSMMIDGGEAGYQRIAGQLFKG